ERLLKPGAEKVGGEPVIRLLRAHERRAVASLERIDMHRFETQALAAPGNSPWRLDMLEPRRDRAGAGLPAKLRSFRNGTLHRDRLHIRVPSRPLGDAGEHVPDDIARSSDLGLTRSDDRCRQVDAVLGRLGVVLDDTRLHDLLLVHWGLI